MKEGLPENMGRRNFVKNILKGAGAAVGLAATGAAGKKVFEVLDESYKEDMKHEKITEVEITGKNINGGSIGLTMNDMKPMEPGISIGGGMKFTQEDDEYAIVFKINGKENTLRMRREDFESYKVGQKIKVKYDDRTNNIRTIVKEQK